MLERAAWTGQMEASFEDIPGDCKRDGKSVVRFGRLIVTGIRRVDGRVVADCQCDCGSLKMIRVSHLRSGGVQSCGCLKRETARRNGMANRKHGQSVPGERTATYRSWETMKARCLNPHDPSYKDYGARGITVCQEWRESFEAFFIDMGDRPRGMTIDRIDVNDGYCPGNCRWSSPSRQGRNKRNNRLVEFRGETVPLVVVAEQTGVPYQRLHERIVRRGWSVEDAINKPSRAYN